MGRKPIGMALTSRTFRYLLKISVVFLEKNVRVLEQQILQLQSQLQQQLNMRTMQQPLMAAGMQMPLVPPVDPNQG